MSKDNDAATAIINFKYGPNHSPKELPVYVQIIILHVIALVLGIIFFLARRYVVHRINHRVVSGPKRRYMLRKKRKTNKAGTSQTRSSSAHPSSQVPSVAGGSSSSNSAPGSASSSSAPQVKNSQHVSSARSSKKTSG